MARPNQDRLYLPSVPSPLNPATCPGCSRSSKKQHPRAKPAAARQSPTLSHAQHILRAKAAEAWRSEAVRRGYQNHGISSSRSKQDAADGPLGRAALDMHGLATPQTAVDLEHSLGLEVISPLVAVGQGGEKASFGFLQPFTVDLTHIAREYRPSQATAGEDAGLHRYRAVGKTVLLLVGLLCLSYCLLPGMRYRATFRQSVLAPVTS